MKSKHFLHNSLLLHSRSSQKIVIPSKGNYNSIYTEAEVLKREFLALSSIIVLRGREWEQQRVKEVKEPHRVLDGIKCLVFPSMFSNLQEF